MTMQSAHSPASGGHVHHWEFSAAPMAAVFGIFFLVPLTFSAYFVYHNIILSVVFAGLGVPLLLFGVAKWIDEGLTQKPLMAGLSIIGLPVFIVSEIFIFLSLFVTYWLMRLTAESWPPVGTPEMEVGLPLIMTVLLVTSSFTLHAAEVRLESHDNNGFRNWLLITILVGGAFLGCTIYEYTHLIAHGFVPGTNSFSSAFFSITGFHASHVLVGLLAFVAMLITLAGGRVNHVFVKCMSIYWHFVDIVWFFVVTQVYFW